MTGDSTYVIPPNSQISRQRITNFSARKKEYRDHAELFTPPVALPVAEARELMRARADACGEASSRTSRPRCSWSPRRPWGHHLSGEVLACRSTTASRSAGTRFNGVGLVDAALRDRSVVLAQPLVEAVSASGGQPRPQERKRGSSGTGLGRRFFFFPRRRVSTEVVDKSAACILVRFLLESFGECVIPGSRRT